MDARYQDDEHGLCILWMPLFIVMLASAVWSGPEVIIDIIDSKYWSPDCQPPKDCSSYRMGMRTKLAQGIFLDSATFLVAAGGFLFGISYLSFASKSWRSALKAAVPVAVGAFIVGTVQAPGTFQLAEEGRMETSSTLEVTHALLLAPSNPWLSIPTVLLFALVAITLHLGFTLRRRPATWTSVRAFAKAAVRNLGPPIAVIALFVLYAAIGPLTTPELLVIVIDPYAPATLFGTAEADPATVDVQVRKSVGNAVPFLATAALGGLAAFYISSGAAATFHTRLGLGFVVGVALAMSGGVPQVVSEPGLMREDTEFFYLRHTLALRPVLPIAARVGAVAIAAVVVLMFTRKAVRRREADETSVADKTV